MVAVMAMTPVHLLHHGASLTIIGLTISLHVAGMFALSPVFGILADRVGRVADDPPRAGAARRGAGDRIVRAGVGIRRHGRARAARARLERVDGVRARRC